MEGCGSPSGSFVLRAQSPRDVAQLASLMQKATWTPLHYNHIQVRDEIMHHLMPLVSGLVLDRFWAGDLGKWTPNRSQTAQAEGLGSVGPVLGPFSLVDGPKTQNQAGPKA